MLYGKRKDLDFSSICWGSSECINRVCVRETAGRQEFLPSLPVQSLDWETFEQYCAWQLFLAHNIPLETIIPILQHLKYKGE